MGGETIGSVTLTSSGTATGASVADGPYAITPSAATGGSFNAGNYSIAYVDGSLAVTPALLHITADAGQHKTAGNSDPALTYGYSGLVNGESSASFTGALTRAVGENAGNYAINQGTLFAIGNYAIGTFDPDVFSILAATQGAGQTVDLAAYASRIGGIIADLRKYDTPPPPKAEHSLPDKELPEIPSMMAAAGLGDIPPSSNGGRRRAPSSRESRQLRLRCDDLPTDAIDLTCTMEF